MERWDDRRRWALVTFCFVALVGLLLQARGALLPSFAAEFGVREGALGLLAPLGSAGYLVAVLAVGLRAGRLRLERTFLVALVALAGFVFLLAVTPTYALLSLLVVGRMTATGVGRGVDVPILSHLYPERRARLFGLYEMSWAVGATLGPLVVSLALLLGDWRLTYVFVGVPVALLALAVWVLDPPEGGEREDAISLADLRGLTDDTTVRTMALALTLTVSVESGVFTWLPFYASQFLPRTTANVLLSTFLVAYVPGRYVASRVTGRVGAPTVLLVAATGLGVMLAVTLSLRAPGPLFGSAFALGFFASAVWPTVLAWTTDRTPGFTGPINAIANAAATLGVFVSPALVGVVAESSDIDRAMWLLPAFAVGLVVVAAVTRRRERRAVG